MLYKFMAICTMAFLGGCTADAEETSESPENSVDSAEFALIGTLPNAVTPFYIPPHVGGDREFKGHGPAVYLNVSLAIRNGNQIWTTITMDALETTSDWTRARGTTSYLLYSSTSPISSLLGPTSFEHHYIDSNHDFDRFTFVAGNLVQSLVYMGDTRGNEAGTRTGVQVYFHPITFTQP